MENTLTLFDHQTEKNWFVAVEDRLLGPVSGKEVALWVTGGELSLMNFAWQEGFTSWRRIAELKDFQALLPATPGAHLMAEARSRLHKTQETVTKAPPPPPGPEQRIWFLYMNNAQYGPFSASEVHLMAEAGRVNEATYLWKKGMTDWTLAHEVAELGIKKAAQPAAQGRSESRRIEKRHTPRKPFEAKIILTDGREVGWAICRDISIGGMQILMDHVPGDVGATIKINVTSNGDIPPFASDGEIVRILEDGRGFSFRFSNLPEKSKAAIEKYIESNY